MTGEAAAHQGSSHRPANGLPFVHGEVELEYLVGAFCLVHAVGNVLGLLTQGATAFLEFIEVIEESLEFGLRESKPALQLLLIVCPAPR